MEDTLKICAYRTRTTAKCFNIVGENRCNDLFGGQRHFFRGFGPEALPPPDNRALVGWRQKSSETKQQTKSPHSFSRPCVSARIRHPDHFKLRFITPALVLGSSLSGFVLCSATDRILKFGLRKKGKFFSDFFA